MTTVGMMSRPSQFEILVTTEIMLILKFLYKNERFLKAVKMKCQIV